MDLSFLTELFFFSEFSLSKNSYHDLTFDLCTLILCMNTKNAIKTRFSVSPTAVRLVHLSSQISRIIACFRF